MSQDFNDMLCMDLKVWPKHKVIILYIIDIFSRFTAAYIVADKKPESIIKPFLESWILTRFGAPRSILVDNGGEFVNQKMYDLCQNFNIRILTTAGYSPHQNGLCERNHSIVDEMHSLTINGSPDEMIEVLKNFKKWNSSLQKDLLRSSK